jgi:hypothetical protein
MLTRYVTKQGIAVYKYTSDNNGNPRYIVHWLEIGLPDYVATAKTRKAGLRKIKCRAFGGGFIFSSYNIDESMKRILEILQS